MIKNLSIITLKQPQISDFAKARNQAMVKVKTDWILFIDTDESLTPALKKEIKLVIQNQDYNYQFKRQDWFLGKKLNFGETSVVRLTRLIQKGTGQWQGRVHEIFQSNLPLKTLKHPLIHQRHLTISQFIDRLNHYTTIRTQELYQQNHRFSLFQLLFYPPAKFILNYFFRLGFFDGLPGLTMAFMMSFHSLMIRIKLYEFQKTS